MPEPFAQTDQHKFAELVHDALGKLYDSVSLQQHALTALLASPQNSPVQRGQDMRRQLLAGIHSVRPAAGIPAISPDWRAYRLLELRYIEGLEPHDVMHQLGLAKSQYYREQARAIDAVATLLWDTYQLEHVLPSVSRQELIRVEAERLSAASLHDSLDDLALLSDLNAILEPLARAKDIAIVLMSMQALRGLVVDRVVLRQAILAMVTAASNLPGVRQLELCDCVTEKTRGLCIRARTDAAAKLPEADLELCASLAARVPPSITNTLCSVI